MARVYATKTKGLRIATRCTTVEQFVAAFHRMCDDESLFVSTLATRPVGLETAFCVDLASGQHVLRGLGEVIASWKTADNPYRRPGVKLGIRRLTADSEPVFEQLLLARAMADDAIRNREPVAIVKIASPQEPPAAAIVERAPSSGVVVPANPLADLSDATLESMIDGSLYEDGPRSWWSSLGARVRLWARS